MARVVAESGDYRIVRGVNADHVSLEQKCGEDAMGQPRWSAQTFEHHCDLNTALRYARILVYRIGQLEAELHRAQEREKARPQ